MNQLTRSLLLSCVFVVCAACASQGGGSKQPASAATAAAVDTSTECGAASNERDYRNPYLRARRVGTAECAK